MNINEFISNCNKNPDVLIDGFFGEYRWLSNFIEVDVNFGGVIYPSVEHAYQAAKTLDLTVRKEFEKCTPGRAKSLGKTLAIREDWEVVKVAVMKSLVDQKFHDHERFRNLLLSTGSAKLVEGNWWHDNFWGDCWCKDRPLCVKPGKNMLGIILEQTRSSL